MGVRVSGPPSTPLLLEKPTPKLHNVLVGDDPAQIRFAEYYLSHAYFCKDECDGQNHFKLKHTEVEVVQDDMVLGKDEPALFKVDRVRQIELSEKVKSHVGIWALAPITKGSDGANAIVRFAASLLEMEKPKHATVEVFGDAMVKMMADLSIHKEVDDVLAAIWAAVWLLTGPEPEPFKPWPRPWDNYLTWLSRGVDPNYRLNALYRELVVFVFAREGDEAAARKIGKFKPKEFQKLKSLRLPTVCVIDSIVELSKWRLHKSDPFICALKVAKIWEK
jgi:hypothetical protein